MSTHTKGEWTVAEFGKHIQSEERCHEIVVYADDDKPVTVALIHAGPHEFSEGGEDKPYHVISEDEALANARGMAAWSDLLEALETALVAMQNAAAIMGAVKVALDCDIPLGDPVHSQSSRLTFPAADLKFAAESARAAINKARGEA